MSSVDISFFSVGHGLFHAGKIIKASNFKGNSYIQKFPSEGDVFTYIYDCGSTQFGSSYRRTVEDVIDSSLPFFKGLKKIDVLFVSHFHKDHVNKLKYLISKLERSGIIFERLVVPYVDIYKRLLMYLEYESGQAKSSIEALSKINNELAQIKADRSFNKLSKTDEHEFISENKLNEDKKLDGDDFDYLKFIVNPYRELLGVFKISKPIITILKPPLVYTEFSDNDRCLTERKQKKNKRIYQLKRSLRSKDDMNFILSHNETFFFEFDNLEFPGNDVRKFHVFLPPIRQRLYSKTFFSEFKKIVSSIGSIEELFLENNLKQFRALYLHSNLLNKSANDLNLTSLLVYHYSEDKETLGILPNAILLLGDTNLGHNLAINNHNLATNNKVKSRVADFIINFLGINKFSSIKLLLVPHHGSKYSWSNVIKQHLSGTLCVVSGSIENSTNPHHVVFDAFKSNRNVAQDLCEILEIFKICNAPEIVPKEYSDSNRNFLIWVNENQCLNYCFEFT